MRSTDQNNMAAMGRGMVSMDHLGEREGGKEGGRERGREGGREREVVKYRAGWSSLKLNSDK